MTADDARAGGDPAEPAPAKLTTHVLDTAMGTPARDLRVTLDRIGRSEAGAESRERVAEARTNADGRLDAPLIEGEAFAPGTYEIAFHAGDYLRASGLTLPEPPFLDVVPIRFGLAERTHYHVPLLLNPYGYSTYRGS